MAQSRKSESKNSEQTLCFNDDGLFKNYLEKYASRKSEHKFRVIKAKCIGYKETAPGIYDYQLNERETVMYKALAARQDIDFILYFAPSPALDHVSNAELLQSFKTNNPELINFINDNHIVISRDWRQNDSWKNAEKAFDEYFNNPVNSIKIHKIMDEDSQRHASRRHHDPKNIPATEGQQHVRVEAIDCLSWMSLQNSQDNLITFVIHPNFSATMTHTSQHAKKMGYNNDTLFYVKFDGLLRVRNKPQSAVEPAVNKEDLLELSSYLAEKGHKPEYVVGVFISGMKQVKQEQVVFIESSNPSPRTAKSALSSSPPRFTPGLFQPKIVESQNQNMNVDNKTGRDNLEGSSDSLPRLTGTS